MKERIRISAHDLVERFNNGDNIAAERTLGNATYSISREGKLSPGTIIIVPDNYNNILTVTRMRIHGAHDNFVRVAIYSTGNVVSGTLYIPDWWYIVEPQEKPKKKWTW